MNILLLDSSTQNCHITIKSNNMFTSFDSNLIFDHTEHLLNILNTSLKAIHLNVNSLNYVIAGIGPGSFTAIRILHSLVKGLFFESQTPILPVPTISLFSYSYYLNYLTFDIQKNSEKKNKTNIYSLIFGKKERYYFSKYNINEFENNIINFVEPEIFDFTFEKILSTINDNNNLKDSIFLLDDNSQLNNDMTKNLNIIKSKIEGLKIINFFEKNIDILSKYLIKSEQLLPLYVRKSDAEENMSSK